MKTFYSALNGQAFIDLSKQSFIKKSLLLCALFFLLSFTGSTQVNHLVISQIYAHGGEAGATYNSDYVELYNPTSNSINVSNWSVQTLTSNGWRSFALPSVSIAAGSYFLVQFATGGNGAALPAPDAITNLPIVPHGAVALVSDKKVLTGCSDALIVDLVGNGTTSCFEGQKLASFADVSKAAFRKNDGKTDTDHNLNDFTLGTPFPRNSTYSSSITKVVPVKLLSFSIQQLEGNTASAQWSVTEQTAVDHFEVEYSTDGSSFVSNAYVFPKSNSEIITYSAKLQVEQSAVHYFRLKVVNENGSVDYSPVKRVSAAVQEAERFSININPARTYTVVALSGYKASSVNVELLTATGIVMMKKVVNNPAANPVLQINELEKFAKGLYYIRITDKQGAQTKKLLIQ